MSLPLQPKEAIYQDLCEILEDLRSLPLDTSILVEGPRDTSALRRLGIRAPIIQASTKPLFGLLPICSKVVILTDYDREGREIARAAEAAARSLGIAPDLEYRRRIQKATMGEISHIEGLYTYFCNLEARMTGKPPASRKDPAI